MDQSMSQITGTHAHTVSMLKRVKERTRTNATRLDRKAPATATLKKAKRHLTELKQTGASDYGNASATLRFYFEKVCTTKGVDYPVANKDCPMSKY